MSQFKIQKEKKFDTKKIWKVAKNILSNQLFVTLPIGHVYAWLAVHKNLGAFPAAWGPEHSKPLRPRYICS